MNSRKYPSRWRQAQAEFHRGNRRRNVRRNIVFLFLLAFVVSAAAGFFLYIGNRGKPSSRETVQFPAPDAYRGEAPAVSLSKKHLARILQRSNLDEIDLENRKFPVGDGGRYQLETTILPKLQKYIQGLLRQSRTVQAAVVVLNPIDGRILAMASRDTHGDPHNLCLKAVFPAASLFKIVSAAAAIEAAGYTPEKTLFYQGSRYTLYKSQLKQSRGRYSRRTSFRRAFASSNNAVFGKIGIYDLGLETIETYADRFYFNRLIPFELSVEVSHFFVPEDEFGLAEVASGFNKKTLLSPLHAALLSAVVVNKGRLASPWLVDTVRDENGGVLYRGRQRILNAPVNLETSNSLKLMMQDTARYGTSSRAFSWLRRQTRFKSYQFGAKTGTINDRNDRYKFDWLAGFCLPPGGGSWRKTGHAGHRVCQGPYPLPLFLISSPIVYDH